MELFGSLFVFLVTYALYIATVRNMMKVVVKRRSRVRPGVDLQNVMAHSVSLDSL
jgi:hypothetical protein